MRSNRPSSPDPAKTTQGGVFVAHELGDGHRGAADFAGECAALQALAHQLNHSVDSVFGELATQALRLCHAGSSGISLLVESAEGPIFRWVATAGHFADYMGQSMSRRTSPCGMVLDRRETLLVRDPVRVFGPAVGHPTLTAHELLLSPFYHEGEPVGTVWVVSHDPALSFDRETVRVTESLAQFAGAAYRISKTREEIAVIKGDLTQQLQLRSRVEGDLAQAQRRLDTALIAAELGIYEWDITNNRLRGDENFLKIFDVPLDADGAAPLDVFMNRIHPEDRSTTAAAVQRSVESGENFDHDYRIITSSGEVRWINSRGRMARGTDQRVVIFSGAVLDITARKRAEEERATIQAELQRVSQLHEAVLSTTEDFAYVFNLKGEFLYANKRLLEVWAKTLPEVVGKTCYDLGYPEWHADMHMREIRTVIETRKPIRGEVPFTGGSGIFGIYEYIFTPVFGPDDEVMLIGGTTRDVTHRRNSEDRDKFLVSLDDATRPLTDASEIMQMFARLLGQHLRVNRCAYADVEDDENTFNLTGDYNVNVPSIVGRYRFDQFGEECLRLMRDGSAYVVEDSQTDPRTAAVRQSYETTQIRSVICVSLKKAGRFVGAMAVHQVSPRQWQPAEVELVQMVANRCWEAIARVRVVRALADSEQQLRLAVSTGRLGVWTLDLVTEELTSSPQCKANYGRPADAPFGYQDYWQAIHPDDHNQVKMALRRCLDQQGEFDLEYRTVWPDNSTHWVLVRGQAVFNLAGRPTRMFGVSLDVTARKEAERELIRLHQEAVQASRAKDNFLAALSHELRTPLNPVLLLASESAGDTSLPPRAREAFEVIRNNVELEARLIDDLLDITSISRGKVTVRPENHGLHRLIEEAVTNVASEFAAKQISLTLDLTAKPDCVDVDRVRMLQVVINLLRNAVKFTPAHGRVVVATRLVDQVIEFTVSDTGIGITAQEMDRVFRAFEQGDHVAGNSHRFGGLGLGLAIARQLVELHGGVISAESSGRNQGTRMVVRLPASTSAGESRTASTNTSPGMPHRVTHQRILLIEDHEPTNKALRNLLERRKYVVTSASNVTDARRFAEKEHFDFVISDIGLPDGDGAELMTELGRRFGLRGIALTGYGMEQDIARYVASGFVAHLIKPVRIEALDEALSTLR